MVATAATPVIPPFDPSGLLPPGIHPAEWAEVVARFGINSHRDWLLAAALRAFTALRRAGCSTVYLDGSFATAKAVPDDYDGCWSVAGVDLAAVDPVLLDFSNRRRAMKAKYLGDIFPAEFQEGISGKRFLDFFQIDKQTGNPKGIVMIPLRSLP